jgi:hypothetical protein
MIGQEIAAARFSSGRPLDPGLATPGIPKLENISQTRSVLRSEWLRRHADNAKGIGAGAGRDPLDVSDKPGRLRETSEAALLVGDGLPPERFTFPRI